jgi:putative transposase
MPKSNRLIPVDAALHVMCRGNNKMAILANNEDKVACYFILGKFKAENRVDIFHYCIMNNHLHLILWLSSQSRVSRFMKQVSLAYFQYYRKKYDYYGHLWQGRFKSVIIEKDMHLLQCGKYIELNPVRAGIVTFPEQYEFSSYAHYSQGAKDPLVTCSPVYEGLADSYKARQQGYVKFVRDIK